RRQRGAQRVACVLGGQQLVARGRAQVGGARPQVELVRDADVGAKVVERQLAAADRQRRVGAEVLARRRQVGVDVGQLVGARGAQRGARLVDARHRAAEVAVVGQ